MEPTEPVTFYDAHPFDWVGPEKSQLIQHIVSRPLLELIERLRPGSLVLDIGCGPGRVLGVLAKRDFNCIGLDLSRVSVDLAVKRYGRPGVIGDNLRLPFSDGCADVVISDGVIHHTDNPEAAFAEICRVVKPSGQIYLAVYKLAGRYPSLYKFPGAIIRNGLRRGCTRPLVKAFAQVPYFIVHFIRSRGRRTWSGARNLFYDYFVTPQVSFLPRCVVEQWCAKQGAQVVRYDANRGQNVHCFWIERRAASSGSKSGVHPNTESSLDGETVRDE